AALGGRAVGEHVAEVAVAVGRADLGPGHAPAPVGVLDHVGLVDRHREARPAGAAVVLVDRSEQGLAGHDVDVDTGVLVVAEFAAERGFGRGLLSDLVLLGGQLGDRLGVLAVSVRHVNSFIGGAARWMRARGAWAPCVQPRAGLSYFTSAYWVLTAAYWPAGTGAPT